VTAIQQFWHIDHPYIDPHFAFVRSLVSFDADSGVTATDLIPGTTLVRDGTTSLVSSFGRFGNGWHTATGTGLHINRSFVGVPSADFTFEFFVKFTSYGSTARFAGVRSTSSGQLFTFAVPSGSFKWFDGGGNQKNTTGVVAPDQWYHVAMVYVTGTTRHYLFLNGVLIDSALGQVGGVGNGTFEFDLGCTKAIGGNDTQNTIDEFRFTHGVARYTSAFTPPSRAFPRRGP
jgi:hypothetical protein